MNLAGLAAAVVELGRQLFQGPAVHFSFEENHLPGGMPVVDPSPAVEFGLAASVQFDGAFLSHQAQQEPNLFLADTGGRASRRRRPGSGQGGRDSSGRRVRLPRAESPRSLHSQGLFLFSFHFTSVVAAKFQFSD